MPGVTKTKILRLLAQDPQRWHSVANIASIVALSRQSAQSWMRKLEDVGLVVKRMERMGASDPREHKLFQISSAGLTSAIAERETPTG